MSKRRPKRPKIRRNAPCPCGSGRKYKRCCLRRDGREAIAATSEPEADLGDLHPGGGWHTVQDNGFEESVRAVDPARRAAFDQRQCN